MSGTSADGVDAALVEWPSGSAPRPLSLIAFRQDPFPADLQRRVHELAADRVTGGGVLRELATLDVQLAERFAESAAAVARDAGVPLSEIEAIASHGQTVAHHPELKATLQIGGPSLIAERTGCTTIANFRPRDIAAGGEGAPLAPFFHWAAMAEPSENRLVLNLGGIANLTWLPRGGRAEDVMAFDTGPANALIDAVVQIQSEGRERMDRDGARARRGRIDEALLARLLDDDYLSRPPPKSTGRERYGLEQAEALVREWSASTRPDEDLVATLVAFTATTVSRACSEFLEGPIERILVGGGGVENPVLMDALAKAFTGIPIEPFDAAGVPARAAEAMAFALMGRNALLGIPNHLPQCTGARRAVVLGEISSGRGALQKDNSRPSSAVSSSQ